jgi:WD40 repeat protein
MRFLLLLLALLFTISSYSQKDTFPILKGPYLGQNPPGMMPEIFAPGILSTDSTEFNCSFTKEGDGVYFTSFIGESEDIMVIKQVDGIWQKSTLALLSGEYREVDPFVTPDGQKIYFSSNRPLDGNKAMVDCDIWFVEKLTLGKWSEPKKLENPKTTGKHDYYYTESKAGAVYFSIFENDTVAYIYYIPSYSDKAVPIKLDYPINTKYREHDPFIHPEGKYLIFSSNRPGGQGSNDLYICFRSKDSLWLEPVNMGGNINSSNYDFCPILSPDGKYFFFSSYRSGNGDVYWVDAQIINQYKPTK